LHSNFVAFLFFPASILPTNIQIGNAGGVNNKTRKTAWAEVEENDSHVKIGNTSIHRQSTSTADRNINEQRKTAHFGNASFNKMAKSMQERKEKQQSSSPAFPI
jgi:hypothetical protein